MRFWTWLLARLMVAVVLVGWVFCALLLPSSGGKEFRRTLGALKKVNSIRYSMAADVPDQHTEDEAEYPKGRTRLVIKAARISQKFIPAYNMRVNSSPVSK